MGDESPLRRDLVVIGASAGGVETLRRVVAGLPSDLPAAVCIVLHIAPESPSALAPILQRAGRLPCHVASDGARLEHGQILVAPPDRHLIVEDGRVRLTAGPRENGHRPAVDPLFRSAAEAKGASVVGVILSGTRDDGVAGLAAIKAGGGGALVQDPKEALYAGMPASALAHVAVDAVAPSDAIADTLAAMVRGDDLPPGTDPADPPGRPSEGDGEQVTTVCPECGGVLSERVAGGITQWECRVGHRYSPDSLANAQAEDVEAALWAAVRVLEDRQALLNRMADQAEARDQPRSARAFRHRATSAGEHAQLVRRALGEAAATTLRSIRHLDADEVADEEDAA
jgi:two-component system chemotaxis response regulator CheB